MTAIQQLVAKIAAILILGLGLYFWGHHNGAQSVQDAWTKANAQQAAKDLQVVHASDIVTQKTITQYMDRVQVVITAGATITKEVTRYVTPEMDRTYRVPYGYLRLLNAAASGQAVDSGTSGPVDDQAAPIALSATASLVSVNYANCRANAVQLSALQDWIRQQQASIEQK